jgi:hypothetical protein
MAKPITNRVKMGQTPVIRKDLEGGVIAEANNDGSIYVDKGVKKGSPLEKEAIAHEKVHLNQMKRGDLNYDDNNVYWKGKAYSRSSMNEGAKNLPWEKEAYNKTKHMNKSKSKSPAKMSDADLVANNAQTHKKFTNYGSGVDSGSSNSGTKVSNIRRKNKKDKKLIKGLLEDNESKSVSLDSGTSSGPTDLPTFISPLKSTPITSKASALKKLSTAQKAYTLMSGYDGGGTETFVGNRASSGDTGTFKVITNRDIAGGFRGEDIGEAPGGEQTKDPRGYMIGLRKKYPYTTAKEFAAKKYISQSAVSEMDKVAPASDPPSSGKETREVSYTPDTEKVPGTPNEPGTYNMPHLEARNLRLAAGEKRRQQNQELRRTQRDFYKGTDTKRKDRQQINPETGKPFANRAEFMEYRKKGQSSISHRSGKNYDGKPATLPTTKKAGPDSSRKTYDDQGREIKKSSGNNDFNVDKNALSTSQQMKLDAARKKFSPASMNTSNKNKAPFKMGGYGSKNK